MSAMATLFGSPVAQAIGWALLHLLWQGVLVAAILAASLALMRKQSANARYLLSLGALVVLLALGAATAYRTYDPAAPPAAIVIENITPGLAAMPAADDAGGTTATAAPATVTWQERLTNAAAFTRTHLPQLVFAWLAGVLLLSARLLGGWLRAHRIATRSATEASPEWQRAASRLADALHLKQTVRLLESAAVEVPAVIGWLRPVVLLPVATLAGLSQEQMEMILAHELAHIRRHDFFVNLMQAMVETLLFYHPAVWWISNRVRVERENCCDDMAVAVCGNPLLYARALSRLEELRVDPMQAVAANGGSLLDRIRRLAGVRAESPNGPSRWAAGAALLVVAIALLVAPALPLHADRQQVDDPQDQEQAAPPQAPEKAKAPREAKAKVDVKAPKSEEYDQDSDDGDDDVEMNDDATPAPRPMEMTHVVTSVAPHIAVNVAPAVRAAVGPAVAAAVAPAVSAAMAGVAPMAFNIDINDDDDERTPKPDRAPRAARKHGKRIGESGTLTVDDLIALRSAGVTPAYIDEMRAAGLGELTLDDIVAMRVQGVTSSYIKNLRDAGLTIKDADTVVSLRVQGVTADYLAGMRAAGYSGLSTRQLVSLRAMGVTPEYVRVMADAGYKNLSADDLVSLRAQGVSPSFIKALAEAGYTNLSARDLVRLAAVGVNADFIRDLAKYRTK